MSAADLLSVILVALGLSADCFAVAVSIGASGRDFSWKLVLRVALVLGFFQMAMPLAGWLAGQTVVQFVSDYDHWIAFALLAFIGGRMIWEFIRGGDEAEGVDVLRWGTLLTLAVATSIDALAVGLSFALLISITFSAKINATANITSVVLEYGTDQLTCGEVVAKAFPQFNPGKSVDVEWTWEMRQSGSLPPGSTIWWRWRYTDETGKEAVSPQQTITWLDSEHNWRTISADNVNLHWYSGSQSFAQGLLKSAQLGLTRNKDNAGLTPNGPINIYVSSTMDDLRNAVLYEPSWTGGLTFSEHNIILIGIVEDDPTWNQNVIVHETTHVLVGNFTFSCLGGLPTWLREGLCSVSQSARQDRVQGNLRRAC